MFLQHCSLGRDQPPKICFPCLEKTFRDIPQISQNFGKFEVIHFMLYVCGLKPGSMKACRTMTLSNDRSIWLPLPLAPQA